MFPGGKDVSIKTDYVMNYVFYIVLLLITGTGEYLHLLPRGTFRPILTLTVGHFTGATVTPAVRSAIENGATHS